MFLICILVIITFSNAQSITPTTTEPLILEDTAEETQHAVCKIMTQEIETFANATIKRQLKGVCTTKQIERRFRQLEHKLLKELNYIKSLLSTPQNSKTTNEYDYYGEELAEKSLSNDENVVIVTETLSRDVSWVRTEIEKLNNTMYISKGEKVYSYYWEIPTARSILAKKGIHVRSSDFYVLGHQLCIQMYPNHLESQYLGIQLRPNSNFIKKHKFTILEPFDSSKDINSQTLGGVSNYESVYRVPYAKLEERNYLYNDGLVIKMTIFLNS